MNLLDKPLPKRYLQLPIPKPKKVKKVKFESTLERLNKYNSFGY